MGKERITGVSVLWEPGHFRPHGGGALPTRRETTFPSVYPFVRPAVAPGARTVEDSSKIDPRGSRVEEPRAEEKLGPPERLRGQSLRK